MRLLDQRREDARVRVALIHRRVGRQAIEVALPVHVPHPGALGALDHEIEGVIVVRAPALFEGDQGG